MKAYIDHWIGEAHPARVACFPYIHQLQHQCSCLGELVVISRYGELVDKTHAGLQHTVSEFDHWTPGPARLARQPSVHTCVARNLMGSDMNYPGVT